MIAEKYENLKSAPEEQSSELGQCLNERSEQLSRMVDEQPARVLVFSCLAGFAMGLLLSRALAHESSVDAGTAERFGRNLLDKIEHALPAMLRERISR